MEQKKYICIAKCPELDYDNLKHCVTTNPNNPSSLYDYDCPCGNRPEWEELADHPTEEDETEQQIQIGKIMIEKMISCYNATEKGGVEE